MSPGQVALFADSEGDRWFLRNRDNLRRGEANPRDPALDLVFHKRLRPRRVLEVGAANGWRLARIESRLGARCVAVEPSAKAIAEGRRLFPRIRFFRGLAHKLPGPVRRMRFDLVLVNFVFHWVDRSQLLESAAQIDSVLEDGGHLLIGDFLPPAPEKVPYHHLKRGRAWTYKQDYALLFKASCLYASAGRVLLRHDAAALRGASTRAAVELLRKTQDYRLHGP